MGVEACSDDAFSNPCTALRCEEVQAKAWQVSDAQVVVRCN